MLRSISTASLNGTLVEKLAAAAAAHFDGVEITDTDLLTFEGSPRDLRARVEDLGLSIMLFHAFSDFEGAPRPSMAWNFDRAERKFDLMGEFGAPLMLVRSNSSPQSADDDAIIAEDLATLAERAAARGLTVGYKATPWGHHVRWWNHALSIMERVDRPNLGLVLDSFDVMTSPQGASGLEALPIERLSFVQIGDAALPSPGRDQNPQFRCFPGQGDLDLPGFLAPLLARGYAGPVSLEVFNEGFRTLSPRTVAADGMRSLLYLEERMAVGGTAAPALFSPPAAGDYRGFEFLEFACDEDSGGRLAAWLEQLGFSAVGRHRSKAVTLFRQGSANLVLNTEPNSFARSFFLVHGTSICNLALAVDDAGRAIHRAQAYHVLPYSSGIGPSESRIPAISTPDGGLVSFVDQTSQIYEKDFLPIEAPPAPGGQVEAIDHVSLGLPEGQFETWLLFFKAILDFSADDTWTVPDPYGTVRSRALRSARGTVRLPLNTSIGSQTATAHSVSSYGGVGVQHIAITTSDIFATLAAMKSRGVRMLEIPRNYYRRLAAEFPLADDFVFTLSMHNVLYDSDGCGGEFLQAYTEPFDGKFLFEIVQRKNYDQYGAANAAVRLAAQMQASGRSPYVYEAFEN